MRKGPQTVAVIMDGNRRWAKARGQSSSEGHRAGEAVLHKFIDDYRSIRDEWGTAHYIFYAFSTENWSRSTEEVAHLMGLFEEAFRKIDERLPVLIEDGVQVRFLGQRDKFSLPLQKLMNDLEEKTKTGTEGTIAIAVSYGGQADILQAVNTLVSDGKKVISTEDIEQALWTHGIPHPDLVIRTGGEQRLSNFLTWQSTYSELYFSDLLWPDFNREELEHAFSFYAERERRHGK